MMRELILRQGNKKSRVPEEEIEVWGSQGGEKDFVSTFFHLGHTFFSLSPKLMITQQNNSSCLRVCFSLNFLLTII